MLPLFRKPDPSALPWDTWRLWGWEGPTSIAHANRGTSEQPLAHWAVSVWDEHPEALTQVLAAGADVRQVNAWDETALEHALIHHKHGCLKTLMAAGPDVNRANKEGITPLMCAVEDPLAVQWLLAAGAQVNARALDGFTPLMYTVMSGSAVRAGVLDLLHAAGADVSAVDEEGCTAVWPAAETGQLEALVWLRAHGLPMDGGLTDKSGKTLGQRASATARSWLEASASADTLAQTVPRAEAAVPRKRM